MKRKLTLLIAFILSLSLILCSCSLEEILDTLGLGVGNEPPISLDSIPEFDGKNAYVKINGNVPFFTDEKCDESYEFYSELDNLGRCGVTIACIGIDLMPTEERGDINSVHPTGWHSVKYNGQYLYHRCHLIGFQLAGENDNEKNLVTGTAYMNVTGMLPFENMVADYVEETENHVLYRVTPIYDGANLVVSGVLMEAKSVEDNGEDLMFCVYVYNVQPGIVIDYKTGESRLSTDPEKQPEEPINPEDVTFILNINSKKFHLSTCSGIKDMKESNKKETDKTREELIEDGYTPCGTCKP